MTVAPCYDVNPTTIPLHRYNELIECEKRLKELRTEIRKNSSVVWSLGDK